MKKKRGASAPMIQFDYHDKEMLEKVDDFQSAVERLNVEGKLSLGRNLNRIAQTVVFFKKDLDRHMAFEDRRLFPYLVTHIPRLEPVLTLLSAEHKDFRGGLRELDAWLTTVRHTGKITAPMIWKIQQRGRYLALLLRSHLWEESQAIDKTANRVLHSEEKKELAKLLKGQCRIVEDKP